MIRAALLATVMAGPASALSCLAPDVVRTTQAALDAAETYAVVTGTLAPTVDGAARMTGRTVVARGPGAEVAVDVALNVGCAGEWCGSLQPDVPHLMFLRQDGPSWVLDLPACPMWAFAAPTGAQLARVRACLAEGRC